MRVNKKDDVLYVYLARGEAMPKEIHLLPGDGSMTIKRSVWCKDGECAKYRNINGGCDVCRSPAL